MNLIATLRMKSSEDGTVILQVAAARRPRKQEQPQDLGHVRMHAVRTGGARQLHGGRVRDAVDRLHRWRPRV